MFVLVRGEEIVVGVVSTQSLAYLTTSNGSLPLVTAYHTRYRYRVLDFGISYNFRIRLRYLGYGC